VLVCSPLYVVAFPIRLHNLTYSGIDRQRRFLRNLDVFFVDLIAGLRAVQCCGDSAEFRALDDL